MTLADAMQTAAELRAIPALAPLGDWYALQAKRLQSGLPMQWPPPPELHAHKLLARAWQRRVPVPFADDGRED